MNWSSSSPFPPFSNIIYEATIPLSVTPIMSQFGLLYSGDTGAKMSRMAMYVA